MNNYSDFLWWYYIYNTHSQKSFSFSEFPKNKQASDLFCSEPVRTFGIVYIRNLFSIPNTHSFLGGILMSIIVSKFGGSSSADADGFRRVRQILLPMEQRRYIVLSAPGKRSPSDEKVTDLLCRAHRLFAEGLDGSAPLNEVRKRFAEIIRTLRLKTDAEALLSTLEADARHSIDRAASRGEYLCARLFALYADLPFVDAAELIHFDRDGRIDREAIFRAVRAMSRRLPCAVIPGFYGTMPNGEIKTFSRGGSDITGALVAAALDASLYENWTDVDGLMSIDPVCCPNAFCHSAVSYRQMRMLASAGAQVLHPYCLEPVCEAGVPTVLKNTFAPERPGTYISDHVHARVPCVCCRGGYRAVPIDSLSEEAQAVAKGLSVDCLRAADGRCILALNGSAMGEPASMVTVFGLTAAQRRGALAEYAPIASLNLDACTKYLVPPEDQTRAMCALHAMFT